MNKPKFCQFNDGIVRIYRDNTKRADFGAKRNVAALEDMEFVAKLDFKEASRREQDMEFAEQFGCTLSLKVHTRNAPNVDNKCKAVINNYLFDVWYVDKTKTDMYLYLEGVKPLDTE